MTQRLRGVIAAITTPVTTAGEPDLPRFLERARQLLEGGCDGLNVLGTTGEATSFSVSQRMDVMNAVAGSGLPLARMMVGTGAAAVRDAALLTREAGDLGFAGALLLPPFYYKPITGEGLLRFFDVVAAASAAAPVPLYLYNFPALSGVVYTPAIVAALIQQFGTMIAGLKDSSGDVDYAREIAAVSPSLDVFPSSEANLMLARDGGPFAGCISATANLNAADCALALHRGDGEALARAVAVRNIFDGLPLVPGIKALIAHRTGDPAHALNLPPFAPLTATQLQTLLARHAEATSAGVAA